MTRVTQTFLINEKVTKRMRAQWLDFVVIIAVKGEGRYRSVCAKTVGAPSRLNLARSAFSRLHSCLWKCRCTDIGAFDSARVASTSTNERMLAVFDNDNTRHILHMRRRDYARNCGTTSVLLVYQHSSSKEGSAGLVTLRDFPMVS